MNLSITSEAREDAQVVHIGGDLDVYTAPQLRETLEGLDLTGKTVVLDMARVHFIDSTALGVLVAALQQSRAVDGDLLLVFDDPYLRKIFRITGFDTLFSIFPGVAEALEGTF
jgi:anti-sigma B factor antagonist